MRAARHLLSCSHHERDPSAGRLAEAYELYTAALDAKERGRGADAELAGGVNNLAVLLMDLGRHDEARGPPTPPIAPPPRADG